MIDLTVSGIFEQSYVASCISVASDWKTSRSLKLPCQGWTVIAAVRILRCNIFCFLPLLKALTAMLPATQTLYFEDLSIGMSEIYSKEVKSSDVIGFAEISGDRNPIHLSEHFAAQTPFKGRIAHGLYTASLISAVIGTRLPGPGAIYMQQTLNFKAPVRIGDVVTARVEVLEMSEKGNRVRLACTCSVGDLLVLEGEALVKVPSADED